MPRHARATRATARTTNPHSKTMRRAIAVGCRHRRLLVQRLSSAAAIEDNSSLSLNDNTDHNNSNRTRCGRPRESEAALPPPLPPPQYSVLRRILPASLVAVQSQLGRQRLGEAWQQRSAAPYHPLVEHSSNQSDPAYCGITSLIACLNALVVDPGLRWKSGWRYFHDESVLLQRCRCWSVERIRRVGITLDECQSMAECCGVRTILKRAPAMRKNNNDEDENGIDSRRDSSADAEAEHSLDDFRKDVIATLCENPEHTEKNDTADQHTNRHIIVSFDRSGLDQTGTGHFSPLAAYHAASDSVLLLDVARFKYPHYWVSLPQLHNAMRNLDEQTQQPRGWLILQSSSSENNNHHTSVVESEHRLPASEVPLCADIT